MSDLIDKAKKALFSTKEKEQTSTLSREDDSRITEAQAQAFIGKTVICIIYAMVGDVITEVNRRKVPLSKKFFTYKGGNYLLLTTKDKVRIQKAPWYSLGVQYYAVLEFKERNGVPLSHEESKLIVDANGLERLMSEKSRDTLLPKSDSMLMFMLMLALVGMLIMMGLCGYLLTDPNGVETIRNINTPGGAD